MAGQPDPAFNVGSRTRDGAAGEEEGGETAREDAPAKVPATASPVGLRLRGAGRLSAADAARPIEVSPRFAVSGARWLATIASQGPAKC